MHFAEAATMGPMPLVVAGALSIVTLVWAAGRLHEPVRIDPLMILIGLTVHTYLTIWEAAVSQTSQRSARHRRGIDQHFAAARMTCAGLKTWSCGNNDGSVPCKLVRVADGSKGDVESTPARLSESLQLILRREHE